MELLPGVGPTTARTLRGHGIRTVFDLLCTLPVAAVDLRAPLSGDAILAHAREARGVAAIRGRVLRSAIVPMRGRRAVRVTMVSGDVTVELWWFFHAAHARQLSGEIVAIGAPRPDAKRKSVVRLVHPRTYAKDEALAIEPIYAIPSVPTARVASALRAEVTSAALDEIAAFDPVPVEHREGASFARLLRDTHAPEDLDAHLRAREALRRRLAWAEASWLVLRRLERERAASGAQARALPRDPRVESRLVSALGFEPTGAQRRAIDAISARLADERPSRSLLTGDVGTGKTAVLLAAAAQAVAAGAQVALLAPTTVLADQYAGALEPLVRATSARVATLPRATGRTKAEHARVTRGLEDGTIDVVVGTHAILGEGVAFARLGLVIVDEQHRLGVGQRLALVGKGGDRAPHLISVSATPIPRTLALSLRGEIATTHLDERPRGRTTPATSLVPRAEWGRAKDAIAAAIARDERAFVVCATIAGSEDDERGTPGAVARATELRETFGRDGVALVHGELDDDEARAAVAAFRRGDAKVLVGTSLLEVGVDVPEATLMVVDGADRLGLAQVHQLRGRVGRGDAPGTCLLVHDDAPTEIARRRLEALVVARDGLEVAKADLALRGPGDFDGARQSGEAAGLRWLDPLGDDAIAASAARAVAASPNFPAGLDGIEGLVHVLARLDRASALARGAAARRDAG